MQEMIGWSILLLAVMLIAAMACFLFRRKNIPLWKDYLIAFILVAVFFVPVWWLLGFVEPVVRLLLGNHLGQVLLWTIAMGLGVLAYMFRRKDQLRYGLVEVFFGAASSAYIVGKAMNVRDAMFTQWVGLAASIYVVVRGLNNMSEHIEAKGDGRGNKTLRGSIRGMVFEDEEPRDPDAHVKSATTII